MRSAKITAVAVAVAAMALGLAAWLFLAAREPALPKIRGYVLATPRELPAVDLVDEHGAPVNESVPDAGDSGIYLRGSSKSQVNIWCWPIGSGEVYGYRMDAKMPPEVRAAVTPKKKADRPVGEWNTFEITLKGDHLWVRLNDEEVISNAQLPGIPAKGPIGLQHHGSYNATAGKWTGPPSLIQFKNIYIKELK